MQLTLFIFPFRNGRLFNYRLKPPESICAADSLRLLLVLILVAILPAPGDAQKGSDTLQLLLDLPVKAFCALTDNLSNVYLITPDNAIEKYGPDGRLLTRYSNNRLGRATMLDVSNPLKVLVWYPDFRMAVFLDRSLTLLGELNLISAGYPEVRTIGASQDGNLWLYDEVNFRLVKITTDGEQRFESQSMNQLEPTLRSVSCLHEYNDRVYLADSTQGLFIFDVFAQFDRFWSPMHPVKEFQVVDDQVQYLFEGRIVAERLQIRADREIGFADLLSPETVAMLSPRRLLLMQDGSVRVYGY